MNKKKQVSVIIAQYNPCFDKLKKTLYSVIRQKNIDFEVIIADDGSKITFVDEMKEICERVNFYDLKLSCLEENIGTVSNIYFACCKAEGDYIKVISPGDIFADDNTLYDWYFFTKRKKADLSFGDLIYYNSQSYGHPVQLIVPSFPVSVNLFRDGRIGRLQMIDYLVAHDGIVGASILVKRELFLFSLKEMLGKVIYAEDFFVRKVIAERKRIIYFPQKVIWYEYGLGISTSKNEVWAKRIKKDLDNMDQILQDNLDNYSVIIKQYCMVGRLNRYLRRVMKILLFPEAILLSLRIKLFPRKSKKYNNETFYLECSE